MPFSILLTNVYSVDILSMNGIRYPVQTTVLWEEFRPLQASECRLYVVGGLIFFSIFK
jgi:hypothetical protein